MEWFYKLNEEIVKLSVSVWERAFEVAKQPAVNTSMLWVLLPLLTTLFLMQLYFGRYKREELGWNSALGNSVVLLFVGANLFSYILRNGMLYFSSKGDVQMIKTIISSVVILESIALIVTNFFHTTPKKIAFNISSVLVLNFVAALSVILVYSDVAANYITILAALAIFLLLSLFFEAMHIVIPEQVKEELKEIKEEIKKDKAELNEVEVEKKEREKEEIKKEADEIKKKEEEIKRLRDKIKEQKKEGRDNKR